MVARRRVEGAWLCRVINGLRTAWNHGPSVVPRPQRPCERCFRPGRIPWRGFWPTPGSPGVSFRAPGGVPGRMCILSLFWQVGSFLILFWPFGSYNTTPALRRLHPGWEKEEGTCTPPHWSANGRNKRSKALDPTPDAPVFDGPLQGVFDGPLRAISAQHVRKPCQGPPFRPQRPSTMLYLDVFDPSRCFLRLF